VTSVKRLAARFIPAGFPPNRLVFAALYDNVPYCELLLAEAGIAALGQETVARLAAATGLNCERQTTPRQWHEQYRSN